MRPHCHIPEDNTLQRFCFKYCLKYVEDMSSPNNYVHPQYSWNGTEATWSMEGGQIRKLNFTSKKVNITQAAESGCVLAYFEVGCKVFFTELSFLKVSSAVLKIWNEYSVILSNGVAFCILWLW